VIVIEVGVIVTDVGFIVTDVCVIVTDAVVIAIDVVFGATFGYFQKIKKARIFCWFLDE